VTITLVGSNIFCTFAPVFLKGSTILTKHNEETTQESARTWFGRAENRTGRRV
jgi:hypothetical protein